jgi:hypothetical protein
LHLDNIQTIREEKEVVVQFIKYNDYGSIITLDVTGSTVKMLVKWRKDSSSSDEILSCYEIVAADIYWEETGIFED